MSCFSGYGAAMRIVRTEVRIPDRNTTEDHYNFVVAQPLVILFISLLYIDVHTRFWLIFNLGDIQSTVHTYVHKIFYTYAMHKKGEGV